MLVTMNIDEDVLDKVVLEVLKDSYNILKSGPFSDDYDSVKYRKAFRKIIQYYSTPSEYDAWKSEIKS